MGTVWSDNSSQPPTTRSNKPVWRSLEPLGVIRGGAVTGGGTVGGHTSGRERAAQLKHKYSPWLSVALVIMLFIRVNPSASSDTVGHE